MRFYFCICYVPNVVTIWKARIKGILWKDLHLRHGLFKVRDNIVHILDAYR